MVKFTVLQLLGTTTRVTVHGDVDSPPKGWGIVARVKEGQAFREVGWRPEMAGAPAVAYFSDVMPEGKAFE